MPLGVAPVLPHELHPACINVTMTSRMCVGQGENVCMCVNMPAAVRRMFPDDLLDDV